MFSRSSKKKKELTQPITPSQPIESPQATEPRVSGPGKQRPTTLFGSTDKMKNSNNLASTVYPPNKK